MTPFLPDKCGKIFHIMKTRHDSEAAKKEKTRKAATSLLKKELKKRET